MDSIDRLTAENNLLDAEIYRGDCVADRERHLSTDPRDDQVQWWLDLLDHNKRVRAARQLLDRRRRELVALKAAA